MISRIIFFILSMSTPCLGQHDSSIDRLFYSRSTVVKTKLNRSVFKTQMVKIAIIDTGYSAPPNMPDSLHIKLCKTGHYDFSTNTSTVGYSGSNHGTVVATIIASILRDVNYCAIIYQVDDGGEPSMKSMIKAYRMARHEGVVAVNLSIEGIDHDYTEALALKDLANSGATVFIAAGNRNLNMTQVCISYPSCYKLANTVVVGATGLDDNEHKAGYSNYGQEVTAWYPGSVIFNGVRQNGTSFAAPRALADFVYAFVSLPSFK
jgi:hypothetical protein